MTGQRPITLLVVLALIGCVGSVATYFTISQKRHEQLFAYAHTIAAGIREETVATLEGDEEDTGSPAYAELKQHLMDVRERVGDEVRFIYLLGENARNEVFFYADSEDPASPDYSPPGQIYYEATHILRAVFADGMQRVEGPVPDRWGVWISAYVPVRDESGEVVGVLGVDVPAREYLIEVALYTVAPLLIMLLIGALLVLIELRREARS